MMRKVLLLIIIVTSAFTYVSAQKILSLEEAVATALKNNYDIQLAKIDSSSSALDYSYRWVAFIPRLNATTGIVFNNNDQLQKFSNGNIRQAKNVRSDVINGNLQLNWTLFDGLKMFATRDKLEEIVKLGELNIKNNIVNTIADVINNYYNIVRQKQQLKAIEEQMSISTERVRLADKKLSVGLGSKPELLQAKVDLNAQKASQLRQQALIAQLKDQLNITMNIEATSSVYDVSDSIPFKDDLKIDEIINEAEKANPLLQIARKNIDITKLTLKEQKADRFPSLTFNSNYNYSRTDNSTAINPNLPIYSRNNGFNYGLTIGIPILNGLSVQRQIKQTQIDLRFQQVNLDRQKATINLGIMVAFKDYQLQKQDLALEEENINLARENVSIALERFKQGVSTFLELREAQKSLEDAFNRLIAARYNTKLAETELLRLKGDIIK
ncbi:MAG TPA: TolC family protein [Chitinophagaceae bacterium]|nr:TolC family protein [Chitinophagaceae bacterium]